MSSVKAPAWSIVHPAMVEPSFLKSSFTSSPAGSLNVNSACAAERVALPSYLWFSFTQNIGAPSIWLPIVRAMFPGFVYRVLPVLIVNPPGY